MTRRSSAQLVRDLARGLEPVRPVPPLRHMLAAVVGVGLAVAAAHWLAGALLPMPGLFRDPVFVAVFVGLALTAGGALAAALAAAVPGREAAARGGRTAALLGVLVALGGGLVALLGAAAQGPGIPLAEHLACAGRACALGILPALVAGVFLVRAARGRPLVAAGVAALGAVALGALAVHSSCAASDAVHWLLGHSLGPIAGAALLALPLAACLRGRARSSPWG